MAKINIEQVKQRLLNTQQLNINNGLYGASNDIIEYVDTINDNLYIFNIGNKSVLSPADDTLNPIFAEFDDKFTNTTNLHPELKSLLSDYSKLIDKFQSNEEEFIKNNIDLTLISPKHNDIYSLPNSTSNLISEDDLVDLGLPSQTKWLNKNMGADTSIDIGDYYAFGELTPITTETYSANDYKFYKDNKYQYLGYSISCNSMYDPAFLYSENYSCTIPDLIYWEELIQYCSWELTTINGVNGYLVTGPNSNSIFLPFTGYIDDNGLLNINNGYYLLANQTSNISNSITAYISPEKDTFIYHNYYYNNNYNHFKYVGRCIRPVKVKNSNFGKFIPYNWGQGNPYNSQLPSVVIDGIEVQHFLVGCTGIAFAMALNYYANYKHYKIGISNLQNYISNYKNKITYITDAESLPPIKEFNYTLLNVSNKESFMTNQQIEEIGKFIKYVDYAIQMQYCNYESGQTLSMVKRGIDNCVRYNNKPAFINSKVISINDVEKEFYYEVLNEIKKNEPVLISGFSDYTGHTFICDGYSSAFNYFHFNWGWDGQNNGWFRAHDLINSLNKHKQALLFNPNQQNNIRIGDINLDGETNITDIILLGQFVQHNIDKPENKWSYNPRYDIDKDNDIDIIDQMLLMERAVFHRENYILQITYNVENVNTLVKLFNYGEQINGDVYTCSTLFEKIMINYSNISMEDIDNNQGMYQFNSTGKHTVQFKLRDERYILVCMFMDCTSITEINIPYGIVNIQDLAFKNCINLTTIKHSTNSNGFPEGLSTICGCAFQNCTNLKKIILPFTIKSLLRSTISGGGAFTGCTNLKTVIINAKNPPAIYPTVFDNTHHDLLIYVPAESLELYKNYNYIYPDYKDILTPLDDSVDEEDEEDNN